MAAPRTCDCGECRTCKKREYMRQWYASKTADERRAWVARRDPEKIRASDRARYQRDKPKRLAAMELHRQRERLEHPEKIAARRKVAYELRTGRLVRQACHCGSPRTHAHHPDYTKPLEVIWVCALHHREIHRAEA